MHCTMSNQPNNPNQPNPSALTNLRSTLALVEVTCLTGRLSSLTGGKPRSPSCTLSVHCSPNFARVTQVTCANQPYITLTITSHKPLQPLPAPHPITDGVSKGTISDHEWWWRDGEGQQTHGEHRAHAHSLLSESAGSW